MTKLKQLILLVNLLLLSQLTYSQQDTTCIKPLHIIKFNLSKIFTNELAFSYEIKIKNKAAEAELCYVYPTMNDRNPIFEQAMFFASYPALYYKGISMNIFYKWYRPSFFYYGVSAIYKHVYFENKWIPVNGSYQGEYSLNCSQTRNSFGLAFRCGSLRNVKNITFDKYVSLGIRIMNSGTSYNYYEIHRNGYTITSDGKPGVHLFKDEGTFLFPYVNLGCKIGFGWPQTSLNRKIVKKTARR